MSACAARLDQPPLPYAGLASDESYSPPSGAGRGEARVEQPQLPLPADQRAPRLDMRGKASLDGLVIVLTPSLAALLGPVRCQVRRAVTLHDRFGAPSQAMPAFVYALHDSGVRTVDDERLSIVQRAIWGSFGSISRDHMLDGGRLRVVW
jgi:hypothetical protein